MEGKIRPLRLRESDKINIINGGTSPTSPELQRTKKFQQTFQPVCYHFEDLAKTPMADRSLIPLPLSSPTIPTFFTVSAPTPPDTSIEIEEPLVVTRSKSGYRKKTSQQSLSTIAEHIPEVYRPTEAPPSTLIVDTSEDEPMTLEASPVDQELMATRSEVNSIDSHRSVNAIYIKPSPQLASMQSVGEHLRSTHDATPYGAWTRSRVFLTQSQHSLPNTANMPKGSPRSVFKTLGEVEEATPLDTRPAFYKPQFSKGIDDKDIRISDATQSTTSFERSTKWIESYLTRRADADAAEEAARRKQEKSTKWDLTRINSISKLKRRISSKKGPGFEPRSAPRSQLQLYPQPEYTQHPPPAEKRELTPPPTPPEQSEVQELYHLFPQPPTVSSVAHLLVPRPPPPPPPCTPIPFGKPAKTKPPCRPLLSKQRFHSVSGASLSRFLLRRKALGVAEPGETSAALSDVGDARDTGTAEKYSRRHSMSSKSLKLGRRASVGVKEIVARFEKVGGREEEKEGLGKGSGGGSGRRDSGRWGGRF